MANLCGPAGQGVWLIENRQQLLDYAERESVLYVQKLLPIVGTCASSLSAAKWSPAIGAGSGFLNNVSQGGQVTDLRAGTGDFTGVGLARYLDIDHAGFDVAMVDDHPFWSSTGYSGTPACRGCSLRGHERYLLGQPSHHLGHQRFCLSPQQRLIAV